MCGCVGVWLCAVLWPFYLSMYARTHTNSLSLSLSLSPSLSLSLSQVEWSAVAGMQEAKAQTNSQTFSLVVLFSTHTGPLTFENVCQGQVTLYYYYYYYSTIYIYIYSLSLSLSLSLSVCQGQIGQVIRARPHADQI